MIACGRTPHCLMERLGGQRRNVAAFDDGGHTSAPLVANPSTILAVVLRCRRQSIPKEIKLNNVFGRRQCLRASASWLAFP